MAKCRYKSNRRAAAAVAVAAYHGAVATYDDDDDDDDDITSSRSSTPKSLSYYLDKLFEKRQSTREEALSAIIEAFTSNLELDFAEENFASLMYRCLNSIKRGSSKEISLAYHAIGLLAITIGSGDHAHELYEKSLAPLSKALKSGFETLEILDCLAIVTFIGGNNTEEIERSMQIIWKVIHPGSNVFVHKRSADDLCAAISTWSFLLTIIDGWKLNHKYWQGAISYFLDELKGNDKSVQIAARAALALIIEIGSLEKFSSVTKVSTDQSTHEKNTSMNGDSSIQALRDWLLKQVRNISAEASGESSSSKAASNLRNGCWNDLKFFQDGYCPEISMKIGGQRLNLSMWSQSMQLNFLKRFLGGGFVKHMLVENELLHDVFEFTPVKKHQFDNGQFISDREEVFIQFFLPEVRNRDCYQRIYMSPNSVLQKVGTRLLNKQRMLSQRRDLGHYAVEIESEA